MKRTGEILTFNVTVAPVLNVFGTSAVQTGLLPGGNEALLLLGTQFEFNVGLDPAATREVALVRALKTSMPTILDDDVVGKRVDKLSMLTSGMATQDLAPFLSLPPNSAIIVEANFYLAFKTANQTNVMTASALAYFERVVLTDVEKNAILSARLNNLLN